MSKTDDLRKANEELESALRENRRTVAQLERTRSELERSNSLRNAVLDNVFDAILAYDHKGRRTVCNRSARDLLGSELVDQPVEDWPDNIGLFDPATGKRLDFSERPIAKALTGEPVREVELKVRRADGKEALVHANARPMYDKDGRLIGAVTSFRDITEERRTRDELLQARRLDSLGQLTGGIAHDFNNLLSTMLGSLQLLERRLPEGDERAKKYLSMSLRAAQSGQSLTSRLLTFSKRQKLEPSSVSVAALFADLQPLLRSSIEASIKIDIKKTSKKLVTYCDAAQLEAAIVNLVVNSRDAIADAENGMITIQARPLTVREGETDSSDTLQPGDYIEIAVSDNGAGMPRHVQHKALDPFFSTKEEKGTGLGLSMVYGFVAQSGGHMHIYSEPNLGTTVKLFLPQADPSKKRTKVEDIASETELPRGSGEVVLVVEDEEDLRDVAAGLLRELGYQVVVAESGPEALKIVRSGAPIDLLFTDIVMPGGMTGVQLYEAARRLRPDLPVLYTSGYAHSVVEEIETISDKLLSKPYVQNTLAKLVRAAIEGRL